MPLTPRLEGVIAGRGYLRSAHRGAPSFGKDNSERAILAALEHAPDLIEVDLHRTADGGTILWHDAHIEVGGERLTLARTKLERLRGLRLEDGSRLLTLPEALEATAGRAGLLIDLKARRLETEILSALTRSPAQDAVVCGGDTATLRAVRAAGVPVSYTPDPLRDLFRQRLVTRPEWDALTVYHRTVTPALVERANRFGVRIIAWTVDDPKRMRELIGLGVHGLTTNRIELLQGLDNPERA